ncbi:MAG: DNA-directed RNA polymerase subunit D [Candidatus Aenigmarchaeota archaeon]|nr:DNA-directed RNA polymerase subunit D [Candidatus Aenigmarchaeota archaeon]
MKVRIQKKGKERWDFALDEAPVSFANALRRIMVSEIPVLAIDVVDVHENSSAVFDELVAQRLGLIPLSFDPSKFNQVAECKCEGKGCSLCQVVFALEKKGPAMVHSSDLKSSNKAVEPTDAGFLLLELLPNQSIKLEATARLGTGKEHAKFQAANAVFENVPEDQEDKVNTSPDKFLFHVETISGLEPGYIVQKAAEILEEKAKEFKKEAADL